MELSWPADPPLIACGRWLARASPRGKGLTDMKRQLSASVITEIAAERAASAQPGWPRGASVAGLADGSFSSADADRRDGSEVAGCGLGSFPSIV